MFYMRDHVSNLSDIACGESMCLEYAGVKGCARPFGRAPVHIMANVPRSEALKVLNQEGLLLVLCSLVDNMPYVLAEAAVRPPHFHSLTYFSSCSASPASLGSQFLIHCSTLGLFLRQSNSIYSCMPGVNKTCHVISGFTPKATFMQKLCSNGSSCCTTGEADTARGF